MRKVSSHYYLRPDGTFGKRPVIQLNDEGRIIHVRETGDNFKEEAGLEYYPGIITPGFVASIAIGNSHEVKQIKAQAAAGGVLRLKEECGMLHSDEYIKAWNVLIKCTLEENSQFRTAHFLNKHTAMAAQVLGEAEWGVIREGAKPGILVLKNFDLRNFTVSSNSAFRIIQK